MAMAILVQCCTPEASSKASPFWTDSSTSHAMCLPAPKDPVGSVTSSAHLPMLHTIPSLASHCMCPHTSPTPSVHSCVPSRTCHIIRRTASEISSEAHHPRLHPYRLGITDAASLVSNHL